MPYSDIVQMQGHLLDAGQLARSLDEILGTGADYVIERFDVGKRPEDASFARIRVSHEDEETLGHLLGRLQAHGANLSEPGELHVVPAEMDGVFPDGLLLHHQPRDRGAARRPLGARRQPRDGLRARRSSGDGSAAHSADERRAYRRPGRLRRDRRARDPASARDRTPTSRPSSS